MSPRRSSSTLQPPHLWAPSEFSVSPGTSNDLMDRKRIQPQFQTYTHFSNLQSNLVFKIHQFWWNLPNSVFEVLPWNPPKKKQTMQRDRVLEIGNSPSNLVHWSTHSWNLPTFPRLFLHDQISVLASVHDVTVAIDPQRCAHPVDLTCALNHPGVRWVGLGTAWGIN